MTRIARAGGFDGGIFVCRILSTEEELHALLDTDDDEDDEAEPRFNPTVNTKHPVPRTSCPSPSYAGKVDVRHHGELDAAKPLFLASAAVAAMDVKRVNHVVPAC